MVYLVVGWLFPELLGCPSAFQVPTRSVSLPGLVQVCNCVHACILCVRTRRYPSQLVLRGPFSEGQPMLPDSSIELQLTNPEEGQLGRPALLPLSFEVEVQDPEGQELRAEDLGPLRLVYEVAQVGLRLNAGEDEGGQTDVQHSSCRQGPMAACALMEGVSLCLAYVGRRAECLGLLCRACTGYRTFYVSSSAANNLPTWPLGYPARARHIAGRHRSGRGATCLGSIRQDQRPGAEARGFRGLHFGPQEHSDAHRGRRRMYVAPGGNVRR